MTRPVTFIFILFVIGHALLFDPPRLAAQTPTKAEQSKLLNDMLGWIKTAVEKNSPSDRSTAYKKVRVRLLACAIAYHMLAGKPGAPETERQWFIIGTDVYSNAAILLNTGNPDAEYKKEVDLAGQYFKEVRTDQRSLFLLLRSCKDFSNPDSAHLAVLELIL